MRYVKALACAATLAGGTAAADGFAAIGDRAQFVQIVSGRDMTRLGITTRVSPTGQISGRAFGSPVTGVWEWREGYFCRDINWGSKNLGPNCQTVGLRGNTIRFTADRGQGKSADLTLN